jgi:triosephosphate isomerase
MYFGLERTLAWVDEIASLEIPADTELIVVPSFLAIPAVVERDAGLRIGVGGQNLYPEDAGAFTGEVSGAQLREIGCGYVEVGHAERERLFGESEADVAAKIAAAWRNDLTPLLCIGEPEPGAAQTAAAWCAHKLMRLLDDAGPHAGDLIVAYEPVWAIGAEEAASVDHVATVATALRRTLAERDGLRDARIIYGGSAGVGLSSQLGDAVDGLFLGRFAHDPKALGSILGERSATARH